jgi:hypothetical protein
MEEKKKGFWRKTWEVFQTIGAGAGIIALQHAIEEAFRNAGKKAGEHAGRKVEQFFSLTPDSSGEGQVDNAVVDKTIGLLTNPQNKKDIRDFAQKLQEDDPRKYKRFTGRVALLAELDAEKKTVRRRPPKGKQGPEETLESKQRDYVTAKAFLEELLTRSNFGEKMKFLAGAGVFEDLKKPSAASETAKKVSAWGKRKAEEVDLDQKKNIKSLNRTATGFAGWAKSLRDQQRR